MQHSPGSAVGNGDLFKNVDKQLQKADFIRPPQQIRIWCKCLKKMLLPGQKKKTVKVATIQSLVHSATRLRSYLVPGLCLKSIMA